jgi:hypothetical protein
MSEREISPLEDKLLGQAVANTELEIFRSAMDQADPDEAEEGDRSREEMGEGLEGQHEAEVAEEGDEAEVDENDDDADTDGEDKPDREGDKPEPKADAKPEAKPDRDDKGQFVPRSRLKEETAKRVALEETAKADRERYAADMAALNRRIDEMAARSAQQPQPAPAKVEPAAPAPKPDMFTDPDKYEQWVLDQARQNAAAEMGKVVNERFVSASMADAHETHGDEFVKAYENLTGINPVTQQVVRQIDRTDPVRQGEINRIVSAPNPGRALMKWQAQQATLARVGTDPAKFEESIRNETREALMKDPEFRKQILAELRTEAATADNGRPRNVTRFPKSLSDAAGGQSAQSRDPGEYDSSEESAFDVWGDRRAG